jgi:hypothetical protein
MVLDRGAARMFALALSVLMTVSVSARSAYAVTVTKVVVSNKSSRILYFWENNHDCSSPGFAKVTVTVAPKQGKIRLIRSKDFPNAGPTSPEYECNTVRIPSVQAWYTSARGFIGEDYAEFEVIHSDGVPRTIQVQIVVK